jgi:hypothetical protein
MEALNVVSKQGVVNKLMSSVNFMLYETFTKTYKRESFCIRVTEPNGRGTGTGNVSSIIICIYR